MSARIRSLVNAANAIDESSREDVVAGDVVTVQSIDSATTYAWSLPYVPEGSTATFSGTLSAVSPGSFTVDLPGAYLVRLVVDAGRSTESTQYVRVRFVTPDLGLRLVAAGERRDESGTIPVDADPTGWADDQNANLMALEQAARGALVLVSGEALVAGACVTFDSTTGGGRVVLADAAVVGLQSVVGVVEDAATASGEDVVVVTRSGSITVVVFDVAPSDSDQGSPVYLASSGEVSLTPPVASGSVVTRVGVLYDAVGSRVLLNVDYESTNP